MCSFYSPDLLMAWISGKKQQDEFQLLVDQAKKGYKKTVGMSKRKVTKGEDESTEKLSSVCVGKRL